ncbi:MAG TPA: cyclic 2,3-diphosphoglycerate synthase [Motilibacterales bacterium]|nr:cyclic 2,3-diphosphoglycerate synthase [Motilibacterales bacterium]
MRNVVIMGAGGRDFHVFATVFHDDASARVVAFTAAQIPGIDDRTYPASLAGPLYPEGIPIVPEEQLVTLIADQKVDEVVFAYSDIAHVDVMHKASIVMAAGADFRLAGPAATMLISTKPVVGIGAVRTGCGKSQTTRAVGKLLLDAGLRVALIRHPMPYGDLEAMRVQRFATLADIDASNPTVEEREEYEAPVEMGMVMYAGVDYEGILRAAEQEADVIVWDGGNNDFPFVRPDLMITVVDPLRPGHESSYHPGETTLRIADVVIVNKVDSADVADVEQVVAAVGLMVPDAVIIRAESPVTLDAGDSLAGLRALVVEDGPTVTHGGMPFGAGTVAARAAGVTEIVDPRPYAVGSIASTYQTYPDTGPILPAMGYGDSQLADLEATIRATPVDVVVSGTPMDLGRIITVDQPLRRASYVLREVSSPTLADVLAPHIRRWAGAPPA